MGFEPTTLDDLVRRMLQPLSYWRLYGEEGSICGSWLEDPQIDPCSLQSLQQLSG